MTTPTAMLQEARENAAAAVMAQQRKTAAAAEAIAAHLSAHMAGYAAIRRLRSTLRLASELSHEDKEAELYRAVCQADALLQAMVETSDGLSAVLRRFQEWAAGLDHCAAELGKSVDLCPPLARAAMGRPRKLAFRQAPRSFLARLFGSKGKTT